MSEPEEAGGATEGSQVPAVSDAGEHAAEVDTEQGEGECSKCTLLKKKKMSRLVPLWLIVKPEHGIVTLGQTEPDAEDTNTSFEVRSRCRVQILFLIFNLRL